MPKLPEARVEERQSELPWPEAAMRHVGGGNGLTSHCRGGLQEGSVDCTVEHIERRHGVEDADRL